MFVVFFYSINLEIATMVHQPYVCHPKFFRASCHRVDLLFCSKILEVFWLSQNQIHRFYLIKFTLSSFMSTFVLQRSVIHCLAIFSGPIYCCIASWLHLVFLFIRKTSLLISLQQIFCSHYIFYKANVFLRVLVLS